MSRLWTARLICVSRDYIGVARDFDELALSHVELREQLEVEVPELYHFVFSGRDDERAAGARSDEEAVDRLLVCSAASRVVVVVRDDSQSPEIRCDDYVDCRSALDLVLEVRHTRRNRKRLLVQLVDADDLREDQAPRLDFPDAHVVVACGAELVLAGRVELDVCDRSLARVSKPDHRPVVPVRHLDAVVAVDAHRCEVRPVRRKF